MGVMSETGLLSRMFLLVWLSKVLGNLGPLTDLVSQLSYIQQRGRKCKRDFGRRPWRSSTLLALPLLCRRRWLLNETIIAQVSPPKELVFFRSILWIKIIAY